MVDHDERQILQKLEDDALANARQAAQEKGQQEKAEAEAAEEQAPIENPAGTEEAEIEAEEARLTF